jgi:hypothetical protein
MNVIGHTIMACVGTIEHVCAFEGEPLARVVYDVTVPSFPGKGGRRSDPGRLRSCLMAFKRNGTGEPEVLLRIARARGSENIIAQMF